MRGLNGRKKYSHLKQQKVSKKKKPKLENESFMNIQRATTLEERRFHLCPQSVIRLQKVSRATCLVPQSLGPWQW